MTPVATKPVKHPAKYSPEVLDIMLDLVAEEANRLGADMTELRVLDPMAGVGGVHLLPCETTGVELEPEWAGQAPGTIVGDALALPFPDDTFDVIAVSPCYSNRMADHHEAKDASRRYGYRFALGRMPSAGSAAVLHWGEPYRTMHVAAWLEATRVLKPAGLFLLNVSDFQRTVGPKGRRRQEVVPVTEWHLATMFQLGYRLEQAGRPKTRRMRYGANRERRVDGEMVAALRAPGGPL